MLEDKVLKFGSYIISKKRIILIVITSLVLILFVGKSFATWKNKSFSPYSTGDEVSDFFEIVDSEYENEDKTKGTANNFSNINEDANIEVINCGLWDGEAWWNIRWNNKYASAVKKVKIGYEIQETILNGYTNDVIKDPMKYIEHEKSDNETYYTSDKFFVGGIPLGKCVSLKEVYIEDYYGNFIRYRCDVIINIYI